MKKQLLIIGVVATIVICILAAGCTSTTQVQDQKQVQPVEVTKPAYDFTGNSVVGNWEEAKLSTTSKEELKGYSASISNDGTVNVFLNGNKVDKYSGYMDGEILDTDNDNYINYNLILPNNEGTKISRVHHTPKTDRISIFIQDKYGICFSVTMAREGREN